MEILNINFALEMLCGETDLLKELLISFSNDKNFDSKQLDLLAEKNNVEAAKYVHYFKGAGRQLGAEYLAESGQKLEDLLRGKSQGNYDEVKARFEKDYLDAKKAVKEALEIL